MFINNFGHVERRSLHIDINNFCIVRNPILDDITAAHEFVTPSGSGDEISYVVPDNRVSSE